MAVGESKVQKEIWNCISIHAGCVDILLLKKNKVKLISSKG
jgi:hypothetical protein